MELASEESVFPDDCNLCEQWRVVMGSAKGKPQIVAITSVRFPQLDATLRLNDHIPFTFPAMTLCSDVEQVNRAAFVFPATK